MSQEDHYREEYNRAGSSQRRSSSNTRRSSRKRQRRGVPRLITMLLYVAFIIGVSVFLATLGWDWAEDVLALNKEPLYATISIEEDDDINDVAALLKEEGLIEHEFLFKLFARFTHGESKITWGVYTLNTDMDYRALITNMSSSSTTRATIQVTIPEGYTLDQIFQLLEKEGVCSAADLEDMAANHAYKFSFLQEIPLGDYHRLEGFLFPDTYEFYINHDPLYVINKMLLNFDKQFTQDMRDQAEEMGYSVWEMVNIASMIEKETDGADQADIASVIYNRLNSNVTQGMLQIDATIQYILPEHKETLSAEDLEIDSPYNTRLYAGLPAGPIANPGLTAIQAALNPNSTDYYYYVLGDDGVHHFFKDYDSFVAFKNSQTNNG